MVLGCVLVTFLSPPLFFFGPGLLVVGLVGLAGYLLWRALGGSAGDDPARTVGKIALAALIGVAVLGAAVGVGLAAALGGGVVIASLAVVAGLALIGTAFVGGARWLIVPALALVLPLGIVSAAGIDLDGGIGDRDYRPATMSQVRDSYDLGIGSMVVDLRDVDLPAGRTDLNVDVGLGEAVLYVPSDACITSDVQVGAGASDILDQREQRRRRRLRRRAGPADGPAASCTSRPTSASASIEVVREGYFRDQFDGNHFDRFGNPAAVDFDGGTKCA